MKKKRKKERQYAFVYGGAEMPNYFYVRIAALETKRFSHGLALAPSFPTKDEAEEFADDVEKYMKSLVKN